MTDRIDTAPDLLATVHRLLDALDAERARAEKAEAEVARQKVALESQGKTIVDVAGVMDAMTPQAIEAMMPLITDPMIAVFEAATLRAEAERDQALARLAAVQAEMRDTCSDLAYDCDWYACDPRDLAAAINRLPLDPDAEAALQRVVDAAWNEAVEAGEGNRNDGTLYRLFGDSWVRAWDVMDRGSLDAAIALLGALLPGWDWSAHGNGQAALWPPGSIDQQNAGVIETEIEDSPARALLLAVLRAKLMEMEND